ncbi:MAG: hypothetical protein JXB88_22620 [Spirochaetales bacterium]|nr:hypothetical protein [Spirochaetales bacterium]
MKMNILHGIMLFISFFLCTAIIHTEEKPVIAVLDFISKGIPQKDVHMLVDLLSLNLLETESCYVIGRLERYKILKDLGYSSKTMLNKNDYKEIGERLFTDFIIYGKVARKKNLYEFELSLLNITFDNNTVSEKHTFPSMKEMIDTFRIISKNLISYIKKYNVTYDPGFRILDSLSPVPIKERILFFMQEGTVNEKDAGIKELLKHILSGLLLSRRFIPYFTEVMYEEDPFFTEKIHEFVKKRNCHYSAFVKKEKETYHFIIAGQDMVHILDIPFSLPVDPEQDSGLILASIYEKLPPLSQDILINEIKRNISVEEKLNNLLFSEKLLSHKWTISVYQKLLKSALLFFYAPMLSIISLESDVYFYYNNLLGAGLGYG